MATKPLCSVIDCGKPAYRREWCSIHYELWRRHGDPTKRMRPAKGDLFNFLYDVVLAYDGDECLSWPYGKTPRGYGRIRIDGKHHIVSRLVCEAHNGPPPTPKHQAAHSCGKGHLGCVARQHLSWKTNAENQADRIAHGTAALGQINKMAKLTEDEIREIRALRGTRSQREIGNKFNINQNQVCRIQRRESWGWLD